MHSESAAVNRIGDCANTANSATAAAAPSTVPNSRHRLFDTSAPVTGLATISTVITDDSGDSSCSENAT